jgi:hypothetical protein
MPFQRKLEDAASRDEDRRFQLLQRDAVLIISFEMQGF